MIRTQNWRHERRRSTNDASVDSKQLRVQRFSAFRGKKRTPNFRIRIPVNDQLLLHVDSSLATRRAKLMQVRIVVYEMASLNQRRVLLCSERAQMKGLIFLMHFLLLQALYLLTKYSSFFEEVHIWYYFIAWTQYKSTIMLLWLFCSLVRSFLSWLPECVCQPLQPSMTSANVPTYQTLVQVKYRVEWELFALLNCRQFTIHIYIH